MKCRKPYDAVPFTNNIGQIINVNDPIIAITKCTGNIHVYVGKYMGFRKFYGNNINVVIETHHEKEAWMHKEIPNLEFYSYWNKNPDFKYPLYPSANLKDYGYNGGNIYTLRLDSNEHKDLNQAKIKLKKVMDDYKLKIIDYQKNLQKHKMEYFNKIIIQYSVNRTLKLNRIYLVDTKISNLKMV